MPGSPKVLLTWPASEAELLARVQQAAADAGVSVSAWLREAARKELTRAQRRKPSTAK